MTKCITFQLGLIDRGIPLSTYKHVTLSYYSVTKQAASRSLRSLRIRLLVCTNYVALVIMNSS